MTNDDTFVDDVRDGVEWFIALVVSLALIVPYYVYTEKVPERYRDYINEQVSKLGIR